MSRARIDLRVLREGPTAEAKPVVVSSRWTVSGKPVPFPGGEVSRSDSGGIAEPGRAAGGGLSTVRRACSWLRALVVGLMS